MGKGQDLYNEAKKLIPGGTQLLSKRPEQFLPDSWPAYYSHAKGCEVWDLDETHYIDMSYMGVGACILGYAEDSIDEAVIATIRKGSMCTLNAPEEVALAKELLRLHPWAQMVRYARSGGEAMTVAIRIARAYSSKDKILFCGYHGWHDWYLSANIANSRELDGQLLPGLAPAGVPRGLRETSFAFTYNDTTGFLDLLHRHRGEIGAIVIEPVRNIYPEERFLTTIRRQSSELGIPLVVDEVSSGFRLNLGGAHLVLNLEPDIAVFAKGMSNGYPMGAVIGKSRFMDAAQNTFISSTYWTDRIGPVAALETLRMMKAHNVQEHLRQVGLRVQEGWGALGEKHHLKIKVGGIPPLGHFEFVSEEPLVCKTLFTQEMLVRGFLASTAFYASYAHKTHHVADYLTACDETFGLIAQAQAEGNVRKYLKGPVCQSGFKRLN